MPKDDERLQRNLNALERREKRTRLGRRTKESDNPREPRDRAPLEPVPGTTEDVEPEPVTVPEEAAVPEPAAVPEEAAVPEPSPVAETEEPSPAGSTRDGLPPKVPASGPPRTVQADHLAAAVAALRQLAAARPGFDIVVVDAASSGREGTRISWVEGGPPRVSLAQLDSPRPPNR